MKALFAKVGGVLRPTDQDAEDLLARLAEGKQVMLTYHVPRSPQQHRLFFALLNKLVENSDLFETIDQALLAIKMACHLYEAHVVGDKVVMVPQSIAFESMDGDRFQKLFDRALRVICSRWLAGVEVETLRAEVEAMVGELKPRRGKR